MRAPYSGGLAWPSGNSSTKNHEDRPRGSPPSERVKQEGVIKQANLAYRRISSHLAISSPDEFLVYAAKALYLAE